MEMPVQPETPTKLQTLNPASALRQLFKSSRLAALREERRS